MLPENVCKTGSVIFDFHADDHIDPPFSHVWAWGLTGIVVYYIIRSFLHRAKSLRFAREADAAVNKDGALIPGARFVSGRVEFAEGQTSAVMVHVQQHGTESKSKNGWSHRWTEFRRTVYAHPFYVRRPNGERVRVEPGANPLLVDKPDRMIWSQKDVRTRIAALTPNEEVVVEGVLAKGHDPESRQSSDYRTSGQGWIVTPARGETLHVSAEKLGERHRKRARGFMRAIASLAIVLAFVNLMFLFYQIRLSFGEDICAEVMRKDISVTVNSKGNKTSHYQVFLRITSPNQPQLMRELDRADWEQVAQGSVLAFRHVPTLKSASTLGSSSSTHVLPLIFAIVATIIGAGIYSATLGHRRWYEGKLEDSGSGKLPSYPAGP